MIQYSCDLCKRELDPQDDLRYVVKVEVYAAFDPAAVDSDDEDRDHLEEIQDILERLEDSASDEIGDDVYQQLRFDLCPECRKKFLKNPLGTRDRQGVPVQQQLMPRHREAPRRSACESTVGSISTSRAPAISAFRAAPR